MSKLISNVIISLAIAILWRYGHTAWAVGLIVMLICTTQDYIRK